VEVVGVMDIVMKSAKSALSLVPTVKKKNTDDDKTEKMSEYS
jgi:hypothetical protein